jgi:hypothetical protein
MNAFPNPHLTDQLGMTLRDYFAAKAMTVYWSGPDASEASDDIHAIAGWCYCMADAMMEARDAAQ